jgi:hypothetical protein
VFFIHAKKWSVVVTTRSIVKRASNTGRPVLRIALIGGQGTGKSTLMRVIKDVFEDEVCCVPEIACILRHEMGITPRGRDAVYAFQDSIYQLQVRYEEVAERYAEQEDVPLIVSDRTRYDGIAYLETDDFGDAVEQFERICNIPKLTWFSSYDYLFFLQMPSQAVYEKRMEKRRYGHTPYDVAKRRSEILRRLWEAHPGFILPPEDTGCGGQKLFALDVIKNLLTPSLVSSVSNAAG